METKEAVTRGDQSQSSHRWFGRCGQSEEREQHRRRNYHLQLRRIQKYRTKIGDRVQVGSDSTLVAPISLGDDGYVATATTLRHDIPSGALVFNERQEQLRVGGTEEKRKKMKEIKK